MSGRPGDGDASIEARRVHVTGLVQGVGFRPFVHRLAVRHDLAGWVRNESGEVYVEVEGREHAVEAFVQALRAEAPVLARIETVDSEVVLPVGLTDFRVLESLATRGRLPVSDLSAQPELLPEGRQAAGPYCRRGPAGSEQHP